MTIRCEIISQDRTVYQGAVDLVLLPGVSGEMGILPHHAATLTTLKFGVVKIRVQGREQIFAVPGGLAEVLPDKVTVLVDAAEDIEEIDVVRAEAARNRAETALASDTAQKPETVLAIEAALKRSRLRLDMVKRYRKAPTLTGIDKES